MLRCCFVFVYFYISIGVFMVGSKSRSYNRNSKSLIFQFFRYFESFRYFEDGIPLIVESLLQIHNSIEKLNGYGTTFILF